MKSKVRNAMVVLLSVLICLSMFTTVHGNAGDEADSQLQSFFEDGLWGFRDADGNIVIPPVYDEIARDWWSGNIFVEGFARVRRGDYWGFVSNAGYEAVPTIYDQVDIFRGGFARVMRSDGWGVVNTSGEEIVPPVYDEVGIDWRTGNIFAGDFVQVRSGDYWGFVNNAGYEIVPIIYDRGDIFTIQQLLSISPEILRNMPSGVEGLHWHEVRRVLPLRTPIRITDVFTGISYYVISMSNGNHADVEPVTAGDTALMMESFGGVQTWSGRAVWVTVGDRVFAASIHSMGHAGETIRDNNMNGHVCLHFYGSTTNRDNIDTYRYVVLEAIRAYALLSEAVLVAIDGNHAATRRSAPPLPAPSVPSVWAESYVNTAIGDGLVPEVLQSRYTQNINRAEFAQLAVTLYEYITGEEITGRVEFNDTGDVNVQKAAYIGVVQGVGVGRFAPERNLTREQAAVMLSRLAYIIGQPLMGQAATFADNEEISDWAMDAVGQMQATGIMSGVGNNRFAPQGPYTREQSIITMVRLVEIFESNQ